MKNYSSGMLLRLAYSVAIQVPFDILLLDEALAVGDAEFQEKCFQTFEEMRAAGKTVVLSATISAQSAAGATARCFSQRRGRRDRRSRRGDRRLPARAAGAV